MDIVPTHTITEIRAAQNTFFDKPDAAVERTGGSVALEDGLTDAIQIQLVECVAEQELDPVTPIPFAAVCA